jgi:aminoglycoside phosphotransferase family enzyme
MLTGIRAMPDIPDSGQPCWPTLQDKVACLSEPAMHDGVPVDARETQMAWVFLAGARVLKLKKPIRMDDLDYSSLEARARICAEEVRLNRRLAPDVYRGTARLTREAPDRLAIDGAGETVDWLVVMRRLPDERMLDRAIRAGTVIPDDIDVIAELLAGFYRGLRPEPIDPAAHLARFASDLGRSRSFFAERRFGEVSARAAAAVERLSDALHRLSPMLADRIAEGRIVEGHGDLRPEHVCLERPPVVIDCLEFAPALRLVDPFEELCFLSLECAVLDARWIGTMLVERLSASLEDLPPQPLLAFYTSARATLRARQALAHLLAPSPRTPEKWLPLAGHYLDEAQRAIARLGSDAPRR